MIKDWNFWLSVVTASVAIIALIQTRQQIKLSNKQHLFDKRLENYLIAIGLIQLYRNNRDNLNHDNDEPISAIDLEFAFLTNNTYLEQITSAIINPLKEPSHSKLLTKLEHLNEVETKIKFLFSGKSSILLGEFVLCYKKLLFAMYQYKIIIDKMQNEAQEHNVTLEVAQQRFGEKKRRVKLQEAFDNLKLADTALINENVEEQIKKQIKLH
ncbi:hypothetical protein [Clostridium intestinale]|uniref:Uncharacterized protein n=1 Tax=Clostridium intestinale TaxID=36845 RepID=A0A7D6VPX8_9CLOT|nr:hypothetical protein [Clostridium intestinale]QLY78077.1 hypothetical protein HZF06_13345 [Clostridium intestinale]